jgi:hypothetical protein
MQTLGDLELEAMKLPESSRASPASRLLDSLPAILSDADDCSPGQIHFKADGGGGMELWRFFCFEEAVEGNMLALTTRIFANTGSQAITPASERTCLEEQAIFSIRR